MIRARPAPIGWCQLRSSYLNRTIFLFASLAAAQLAACGGGAGFEPSVFVRDSITVAHLAGSYREMGRQQVELMEDGVRAGADFLLNDPLYSSIFAYAETGGLADSAESWAFDGVREECQGMAEAAERAGIEGWTTRACLNTSYLLVILEDLQGPRKPACTQFVAAAGATADGKTVHGRNLDWARLQFIIDHPTIIVRHPEGKHSWLEVGFPGDTFALTAINDQGLMAAVNECTALSDRDTEGRDHPQLAREIMENCSTVEQAEQLVRAQDHASAEAIVVSDGKRGRAAVFEMTASHMGVRYLDAAGLLFMTNHFQHPDMEALHDTRAEDHDTRTRLTRLEQLLRPGGAESLYGALDATAAISVLRDRYNPYTGETHPPDLFDGGGSIANNGALQSLVFLPAERVFYLALGEPPVPYRKFVGFSLDELFQPAGGALPEPDHYD